MTDSQEPPAIRNEADRLPRGVSPIASRKRSISEDPGRPRRVAIYNRLSRNRDGTVTGLDRQEADCRTRIARYPTWVVTGVFRDDDLSAYQLSKPRPAFEEMALQLEAGDFDVVIAWKADRLVRRMWDWIRLLGRPDNPTAWSIITIEDGIDTSTAMGKVIATLLVSMAEMESETIGLRTRSKHDELARAGRWSGGGTRPFGHRLADPERGDPAYAQLVAVPDEVAVLGEIAERLISGETFMSIVKDLNDPSRAGSVARAVKGGPLNPTVLRRALLSTRMVGRRRVVDSKGDQWFSELHRGEDGAFVYSIEPILPDPIAHAVWAKLTANPGTEGATVRRHLLSGFVRCGHCGGRLRAWKDKGRLAWACLQRAEGTGCGRTSIPMAPVESVVIETVLRRIEQLGVDTLVAQITGGPPLSDVIAAVEQDEAMLEQLAQKFARGTISEREWETARHVIVDRIDAAKRTLGSIRRAPALTGAEAGLRVTWANASLAWRRELLATVVETVIIGSGYKARGVQSGGELPHRPRRRLRPEERVAVRLRL